MEIQAVNWAYLAGSGSLKFGFLVTIRNTCRTPVGCRKNYCIGWSFTFGLRSVENSYKKGTLKNLMSVMDTKCILFIFFRSPPQFFEEVVLVDDESELPHLHEQLERELEKPYYKGRVTLVRNKEREGLIRSRNNGALAARGEVRSHILPHFFTISVTFSLRCGPRQQLTNNHCSNIFEWD